MMHSFSYFDCLFEGKKKKEKPLKTAYDVIKYCLLIILLDFSRKFDSNSVDKCQQTSTVFSFLLAL